MRIFTLASIFLLFSVVAIVSTPAFATKNHGCAPLIPPPVAGTLVQPPALHGILYINEVLLQPHSNWNCSEVGTYSTSNDTWVEIYNAQNQPFDLYSAHVSIDGGPRTNPFYLPFGSAIPPHGFLVVFPRRDANYLETETQTLRLLVGSTPIDVVTVPLVGEDQSYARYSDGGPTWSITSAPTIDTSNNSFIPTPTPTKKTVQATATSSSSSHNGNSGNNHNGSSQSSNAGTGASSSKNSGQQHTSTQPNWSTLKNNTGITATATSTSKVQANTNAAPLQTSNNNADLPRKLVLTVLLGALAVVLFWCWRLFKPS